MTHSTVTAMQSITLVSRTNSEQSTDEIFEQRRLVKRSTADFIREHVTQPSGLDSPVFRDEEGFVTEEQAKVLDKRQKEIWAEAFQEAQKLALIIEESQNKLKTHDSKFKPINAKKFTLAELMTALDNHKHKYEEEDLRGPKGYLRKGFRKLGENAQSFGQWLELVPNSNYSAPIVGSFLIVFGMADRMHKVREEIFTMLTAVPEDFNDLRDYLSVYSEVSDENLSIKAASVCTHILRTLQQAMRFMGENPFKKVIKSLKLDNYEKITTACIENLQVSKKQFRSAVDKHLHSRVGSLFRLAKSSSMLQKMIFWEVLQSKNSTLSAIESSHKDLKQELEELRNAVSNAMYNKLLSDEDERGYLAQMAANKMLEMQRQELQREEPELVKSGVHVSQVQVPGFDAGRAQFDLLTCLSQGNALSSTDIGRLTSIKHNRVFRKWILEPKSMAIQIDGNADIGPADYTSMASFLCAETAHLLEPIKETLVLTYFCGLRAAPTSGSRAGAKDMMASLLGQTLAYQDEDVLQDAVIEDKLPQGIKSRKLDALCSAFESVILQLPESWTVVCFIDAIEFFETQSRIDGTLQAVKALLKVKRKVKKQGGPTFKLLVTAAKSSLVIGREFRPENRFVCSEDPVEESILPAGIIASDILRGL